MARARDPKKARLMNRVGLFDSGLLCLDRRHERIHNGQNEIPKDSKS